MQTSLHLPLSASLSGLPASVSHGQTEEPQWVITTEETPSIRIFIFQNRSESNWWGPTNRSHHLISIWKSRVYIIWIKPFRLRTILQYIYKKNCFTLVFRANLFSGIKVFTWRKTGRFQLFLFVFLLPRFPCPPRCSMTLPTQLPGTWCSWSCFGQIMTIMLCTISHNIRRCHAQSMWWEWLSAKTTSDFKSIYVKLSYSKF